MHLILNSEILTIREWPQTHWLYKTHWEDFFKDEKANKDFLEYSF